MLRKLSLSSWLLTIVVVVILAVAFRPEFSTPDHGTGASASAAASSSVEPTGPAATTPLTGSTPIGAFVTYHVKEGDTLSSIARFYHVSVQSIRAANPGLDPGGDLSTGQIIYVPASSGTPTSSEAGSAASGPSQGSTTTAVAVVSAPATKAGPTPLSAVSGVPVPSASGTPVGLVGQNGGAGSGSFWVGFVVGLAASGAAVAIAWLVLQRRKTWSREQQRDRERGLERTEQQSVRRPDPDASLELVPTSASGGTRAAPSLEREGKYDDESELYSSRLRFRDRPEVLQGSDYAVPVRVMVGHKLELAMGGEDMVGYAMTALTPSGYASFLRDVVVPVEIVDSGITVLPPGQLVVLRR